MANSGPDMLPKARGTFWRAIWFVCSTGLVVALAVLCIAAFERIRVPVNQTFSGSIRAEQRLTQLDLPAHMPLKAVLVANGQAVNSGQTIALYDTDIIQERLAELDLQIMVNAAKRECLLNRVALSEAEVEKRALEEEARLQLRSALRECALMLRGQALELRQPQDARGQLTERAAILDKRLALVLQHQDQDNKRAAAALKIALDRNAIKVGLAEQERAVSTLMTQHSQQRLQQVAKLQAEVGRMVDERNQLLRHIAEPRLLSPFAGRVIRVRDIGRGRSFPQNTPLVGVAAADLPTFEASFELPSAIGSVLEPGDHVSLDVHGLPNRTSRLDGLVSSLRQISGGPNGLGQMRADIELTPEAAAYLQRAGINLSEGQGSSQLTVSLPARTLSEIMIAEIQRISPRLAF